MQETRVRASIKRVDGLGLAIWQAATDTISYRTYKVKRPHALWHVDGHRKLILWGIVIHGIVDGYSCTVSTKHFSA